MSSNPVDDDLQPKMVGLAIRPKSKLSDLIPETIDEKGIRETYQFTFRPKHAPMTMPGAIGDAKDGKPTKASGATLGAAVKDECVQEMEGLEVSPRGFGIWTAYCARRELPWKTNDASKAPQHSGNVPKALPNAETTRGEQQPQPSSPANAVPQAAGKGYDSLTHEVIRIVGECVESSPELGWDWNELAMDDGGGAVANAAAFMAEFRRLEPQLVASERRNMTPEQVAHWEEVFKLRK